MRSAIVLPADPRVAGQARTMLLTFAVASWSSLVLGVEDIGILLVITFAWTSTAALRLGAAPAPGEHPASLWSRAFAVKAAVGAGIWVVLPGLRLAYPDWWLWHPFTVPGQVSAAGATLALCWSLRPFWVRSPIHAEHDRASTGGQAETLLLTCSLFLLSGSPIFGAFALGYIGFHLAELGLTHLRGAPCHPHAA